MLILKYFVTFKSKMINKGGKKRERERERGGFIASAVPGFQIKTELQS